jgi:hypothetical protein
MAVKAADHWWLASPPELLPLPFPAYKAHPRALAPPCFAPIKLSPLPLARTSHTRITTEAQHRHLLDFGRLPSFSSSVSPSSWPPSSLLPDAPLTWAPWCPGRRRFGRPELHRRSPLFKIRPSPSVSSVGEHVPVIPSISSLRFASHPRP